MDSSRGLQLFLIVATALFNCALGDFDNDSDVSDVNSDGRPLVRIRTVSEILVEFSKLREGYKKVITFTGYSGKGYKNTTKMLTLAKKSLDPYSEKKDAVVNIGATKVGIGAVYTLAKQMGFQTTGIVSAIAGNGPFESDITFFTKGGWGGWANDNQSCLEDASEAMIAVSDKIIAIGGGKIVAVELAEAEKRGIPVERIKGDGTEPDDEDLAPGA
ncbi:hypothetical protein DdX_19767 [Ditylenchus destructor]|uniref:Uncharacterized protein n=1 Tax=Ditylenchus destructor TaxID=166010 RepID=A0AAD4MM00_9BILA|nr:hypothetical protein DdX_19767 [Ditylenchus destructor]